MRRFIVVAVLALGCSNTSGWFGPDECAIVVEAARTQTTRCYADKIANPADKELCFRVANDLLDYARDRGCAAIPGQAKDLCMDAPRGPICEAPDPA